MPVTTDLAPQSADPRAVHPTRLGVVDVGSNAVRTMIAEVLPGSSPAVRILESHREPVRLGRDVFLTGQVPEEKIDALVAVLARFRASCAALGVGRIEGIATAAVRDARNQAELLARVANGTGLKLRVISGSEEAWLLTAAVRSKVDLSKGRSILVDLGGGSVEVSIVQDGEIVHSDSYRLGALRVLQALEGGRTTNDGRSFLDLVDEYVRSVEDRIRDHLGGESFDRYVATGGNIDSIADLLAHESKVTRSGGIESCTLADVRDLTARLAECSFDERCARFGLRPDRADTILQAAVVYFRIGRVAKAETVLVPRVGMRDGLLHELVAETLLETSAAQHRDSLMSTCRALGRRYHIDARHAETVRTLATELFDATGTLHQLGRSERTLLEAASLLHDIGAFVNNASHHKHGWYLIRESDLAGLDDRSREVVALVVRYHRRAHPSRKHEPFDALSAADRDRVRKLAAILRVADALDRSHRAKFATLRARLDDKSLRLSPRFEVGAGRTATPDIATPDISLERLGLGEKAALFEEVFGRTVVLEEPQP